MRSISIALFLCALLAGCAVRRPPEPWQGAERPSVGTLRNGLLSRAAQVRTLTLRGSGEILRAEKGQGRRFQAQAALEPPDRFRLFGYVGVFAPLFTLTVREDGFGLHLPLRREVYVASPHDTLVIDGRKMPVTAASLWPVFLPDELAERIPDGASLLVEKDAYHVSWMGPERQESLWVSRDTGSVVHYRGQSADGQILELRYESYRWRGALWYPGRIVIDLPEIPLAVRFDVTELDLNPHLSPDLFALRYPADATIHQIGGPPAP